MSTTDRLPWVVYPFVLLLLLGCGLIDVDGIQPTRSEQLPVVTPSLQSTSRPATSTSDSTIRPTETVLPDTGWIQLRPGLERRQINLFMDEGGFRETIYILRLDPEFFRFEVAYDPYEPKSLTDWQITTGALIVVNGGFFTESNQATGLIVVDGQSSGVSYEGFGGMLAITEAGPRLQWLTQQPYDPNEILLAGLQSFPMLVTPGGQAGYVEEDGLPARRTVIAQDINGQFLFLLASTGTLTLYELSQYLVESDLELDAALNLDGGASTGLLLADPVGGVAPYSLLPSVITVFPK
jgi:hypothetical protein